MANIRVAFAQIPLLDDRCDAYRLFLAEELLDARMSPAALMKGLGFDAPAPATSVPAPAAAIRAASAPGTLAEGLFASAEGGAFLSSLETLASAVGSAALLGAIFVPTPAGVVSHGAMPGEPGLSYSFDEPAGLLRLYRDNDTGQQTVAEARLRPDGILAETDTGLPIARMVGGSLVFDADSLAGSAVGAGARSERDEPKLCPDPSPDVPHGASERAKAYQEQISRLNNPQRPLSRGDAVSLMNPLTGKRVVFDDCRESDGTMIEAKGPGYAKLLRDSYMSDEVLPERWQRQAERQISAAGSRDVAWFFAEPEPAAKAKEWFGDNKKLRNIKIFVIPPEGP